MWNRQRSLVIASAIVVVLVLVAGASWWLKGNSPASPESRLTAQNSAAPEAGLIVPSPPYPARIAQLKGVANVDCPEDFWTFQYPAKSLREVERDEIAQFATAEFADFRSIRVSIDVRDAVYSSRTVRWLRLGSQFREVDLAYLGKMSQLRGLSLINADLRAVDLSELGGLPALTWLDLEGAKLSSKSLSTLPRLPSLQVLNVTGVSDAGLRVLATRCPNLRALSVRGRGISDEGIFAVSELPLTWLSLRSVRGISEAALPALARIGRLRYIELIESGLSPGRNFPAEERQVHYDRIQCALSGAYIEYSM